MMKRSKSLVALLLVLCMAMTFVVPMAFAETKTIKYEFGIAVTGKNITGYPAEEVDFTYTGSDYRGSDASRGISKSAYLGKNQARYADCYYNGAGDTSRYINFRFSPKDTWGAIKIYGVDAGTYDMTFNMATAGDTWLYVYTEAEWNAAIQDELAALNNLSGTGTTLVASTFKIAEQTAYKKGILTGNSSTQADATISDVEFDENGNYVLVFRARGTGTYKFFGLTMTTEVADAPTNPVAYVGETACYTFADALEAAKNGGEIKLAADIADAGDFTIGSGVTLDLNGKNLSAGTISVSPSGVLKDSASTGILTATVEATGDNGGWLPLTNGSGKTLYKVNTTSLGRAAVDATSAKFAFNVHFENEAAYALVEGGLIKVAMIWDGATENTYANSPEFVNSWASSKNGGDNNKDIVVTVSGLDSVEGFKLTPVVAVNGVTINLATIAL